MIRSLLVANRGEIACRIVRTARAMGLRTIAVHSDADRHALHVRAADEAVHIGPASARESYLVGDRIIAAALATGAEAIHPGYGFLSENAEFAQSVIDAGLVWVGPKPASIRAMGLKDAAKARMIAAGVPVTPGYLGEDQSAKRLEVEANAIGYPVLIKAVAGGGGKGMRRVDARADFAEALQSCRREAAASFGDDRVLLEKYILTPRHIEVQVFGDSHGNVVHLFERDCSLQRRHQKVIEEAPAPGMDAATREAMCAAAVRAAKAVDYEGAGTIEFIADASEGLRADRIWFMEMNTRLQVEHPVTEEITGVDLVEWQLRIASGEPLPRRQDEIAIVGHAIEARLYAEDPARGFLPSTGWLVHFQLPDLGGDRRCRIETGVREGDEISPFYDPMIAKLVTHGANRTDAIANLREMTATTVCWPVKCNAGFLNLALHDGDFECGNLDTGLIERRGAEWIPAAEPSPIALQSVALMVMDEALGAHSRHVRQTWLERDNGPWSNVGFRLNRDRAVPQIRLSADKQVFVFDFEEIPMHEALWVERVAEGYRVTEDGSTFVLMPHRAEGGSGSSASDGTILAPMPGKVIAVEVVSGQIVIKGQKLLVLEAMKMEHALTAPFDGIVAELNTTAGAQVQVEAVLARIEKAE